MAWRAAWLLLLLCAGLPGSGALQLGTGQAARVGKACVRTPPPRALAPTSTLLAADMFGKTFLAGISIAAASLVGEGESERGREREGEGQGEVDWTGGKVRWEWKEGGGGGRKEREREQGGGGSTG